MKPYGNGCSSVRLCRGMDSSVVRSGRGENYSTVPTWHKMVRNGWTQSVVITPKITPKHYRMNRTVHGAIWFHQTKSYVLLVELYSSRDRFTPKSKFWTSDRVAMSSRNTSSVLPVPSILSVSNKCLSCVVFLSLYP